MRKNLLYISSHLPSLNIPQAGHKTAYSILKGYSEEYNIYLITIINEKEQSYFYPQEFSFCKEIHYVNITKKDRIISIISNLLLPFKVAVRANNKIKRDVIAIQNKYKFDKVHFEFTAAGYYHKFIKQNIFSCISEHDITYQLINRKKDASCNLLMKIIYSFEYKRQRNWELEILTQADEIFVHNIKDKSLLLDDGIDCNKIKVIHPYVDPMFKSIKRDKIEKHSILFWGAMNRVENIYAVRWFIKDILPQVVKDFPDLKLYIVGANPTKKIINLNIKNIIVTGFVDNPYTYFERCQIAIAPLKIGAGIKIKVLECLEANIPVVSTSVGAEGIKSKKLYVIDDPLKFANKIKEIFRNNK